MAYVITGACADAKDKACVAICPMDCIHEGRTEHDGQTYDMLFINPAECIDCGLCESACPVSAIYFDADVPRQYEPFIRINAEFFAAQR